MSLPDTLKNRKPVTRPRSFVAFDVKSQQYYRCCGVYKAINGKMKRRVFYLGREVDAARTKINEIEIAWAKLNKEGYDSWTIAAELDLHNRGIVNIKRPILQQAKGTKDKPAPVIHIDPSVLKKRAEIQGWFDDKGRLIQSHFVDWQKYCITDLLDRDPNTATLLEQIQVLWNSDPLGTLERIARLGIAPHTLNLGVNLHTNPIAFDATDIPADSKPTDALVIDVKSKPTDLPGGVDAI